MNSMCQCILPLLCSLPVGVDKHLVMHEGFMFRFSGSLPLTAADLYMACVSVCNHDVMQLNIGVAYGRRCV